VDYLLFLVKVEQSLRYSLHNRQRFSLIKSANVVVQAAIVAKLSDYYEILFLLIVEELSCP
jgi:hypothetical protein